jgi:hypothetical protein
MTFPGDGSRFVLPDLAGSPGDGPNANTLTDDGDATAPSDTVGNSHPDSNAASHTIRWGYLQTEKEGDKKRKATEQHTAMAAVNTEAVNMSTKRWGRIEANELKKKAKKAAETKVKVKVKEDQDQLQAEAEAEAEKDADVDDDVDDDHLVLDDSSLSDNDSDGSGGFDEF